jgi:hypothetical protein
MNLREGTWSFQQKEKEHGLSFVPFPKIYDPFIIFSLSLLLYVFFFFFFLLVPTKQVQELGVCFGLKSDDGGKGRRRDGISGGIHCNN